MSVSKPDKRRKYDDAFKTKVLCLTRESRSKRAAARQLVISDKLLYRRQQAQAVAEAGSIEQAQNPAYRALRAENQRLERELTILKSLGHLRPQDPVSTYHFIERQRGHYAVRELCQVLGVAPSAYYGWRQRRQRPVLAWERAVCRASSATPGATALVGCGLSCKLLATKLTATAFGAYCASTSCEPSSPAR